MANARDVAEAAGVSIATVSRVLADDGYPVRGETRRRVLAAAERLGYTPNPLGQGLRAGRSGAIGLCATSLGNPTAASAIEGIIQVCRSLNRQVQVSLSSWDAAEEERLLETFARERLSGVLSYPAGCGAGCYERLINAEVPVVLLNRPVPGLVAPLVRHDFAGGYAQVVRFLAEKGHRAIAALLPGDPVQAQDQVLRWAAAFERYGLTTPRDLIRLVDSRGGIEEVEQAVGDLLASPNRPTALFTAQASLTLIALRMIVEMGLARPTDIEVVGTGDERWQQLIDPRVALLCLDSHRLGATAVEMLISLIDQPHSIPSDRQVIVATRLRHSEESTGA